MNTTLIKVETKDHRGPLQFTVVYENSRGDTDLVCSVDTNAKVSLENNKWQRKDKKKMVLYPSRFFDPKLLTGK